MKTPMPVALVPSLLLLWLQVVNGNPALRALGSGGGMFQGDGTSYELTDPFDGNCNFMSFPNEARTKYAAINTPQFKRTTNCGRCAQVSCVDSKCTSHNSEIVYFVDQCPGCLHGDLDLSPQVFKSISGLSYDRIKIEWKYVDCPVANNPIKYCLKVGSNPFWTAIQPTNFAVGIESIRVNDQPTVMVDSAYYFLADGKSQQQTALSSVHLMVVSITGETIEETIDLSKGGCTQGTKQFTRLDPVSAKDYDDARQQTKPQVVVASSPVPTSQPAPTTSTPPPTTSPAPTTSAAPPTTSPAPTTPSPPPTTSPAPTTSSPPPTTSPAPTTSTPPPTTSPAPTTTAPPPTTSPAPTTIKPILLAAPVPIASTPAPTQTPAATTAPVTSVPPTPTSSPVQTISTPPTPTLSTAPPTTSPAPTSSTPVPTTSPAQTSTPVPSPSPAETSSPVPTTISAPTSSPMPSASPDQTKLNDKMSAEPPTSLPAPTTLPAETQSSDPVTTPIPTDPTSTPSLAEATESSSPTTDATVMELETQAPTQNTNAVSESSTTGDDTAGNEAVTRSSARTSTSWSVIILGMLACVGAVILITMIFVVRNHAPEESKGEDEDEPASGGRAWADSMDSFRSLNSPLQQSTFP